MKKSLTAFALPLAFAASAFAQYQVGNSDFEGTWAKYGSLLTFGYEPDGWHSYGSASGLLASSANPAQLTYSTEGVHGGSYSAYLTSSEVLSVVAQGTLATGRLNAGSSDASDAKSNYAYTSPDSGYAAEFTGLPDSLTVWVKYYAGGSSDTTAKITAILHDAANGGYYQDPYYSKNNSGKYANRIAYATATPASTVENGSVAWKKVSVPFTYGSNWKGTNNSSEGSFKTAGWDGSSRPAYALVVFSTNSVPGGGSADDYLYVDDLEFVYNSGLDSIVYNGKSYLKSGTSVSIDADYDSGLLSVYTNGVGATYEASYDEDSYTLTITVKGDNIGENSDNYNIYSVKFSGSSSTTTVVKAAPAALAASNGIATVSDDDDDEWDSSQEVEECNTLDMWDDYTPCNITLGSGGDSVSLSARSALLGAEITITPISGVAIYKAMIYYPEYSSWMEATDEDGDGSYTFNMGYMYYDGELDESTNADGVVFVVVGPPASVAESIEYTDYLRVSLDGFVYDTLEDGSIDTSVVHSWMDPGENTVKLDSMDNGTYLFFLTDFAFNMLGSNMVVGEIVVAGIEPDVSSEDGSISFTHSDEIILFGGLEHSNYEAYSIGTMMENNTGSRYVPIELTGEIVGGKLYLSIDIDISAAFGYNAYVVYGSYAITNNASDLVTVSSAVSSDSTVAYDTVKVTLADGASIDDIAVTAADGSEVTFIDSMVTLTENYETWSYDTSYYTGFIMPAAAVTITSAAETEEEEDTASVVASYSFYDYLMVIVNDEATEPSAITVYLDSLSDGTYYFKLNNFILISGGDEMAVGNIVLSDLEPVEGDDGSITFSVNESITIAAGDDESVEKWFGPMLGEVPLELTGTKTASGKLYFHIDIDMTGSIGQIIAVEFGTYQIAVAEGAEDLVSFSARSGVDSTTVGDTVYVTLADGVDADSVTITAGNSTFSLAGTTTIEEVSGEDTAEVEVYYFIMPEAAVTITATASETEDGTGSSSSESTGSSSSESTGSSSSGTPIIASNAAKAQDVSLYMNARTLNVTAPAGSKLYLFDITGHTVAVKTLSANTAVSLEGLPSGNLFAVVTSEQGSRLASKRISLK